MELHLAAIAISVALIFAGYVFFFKGLNEQLHLQHEINSKLPEGRKFEPMFWGLERAYDSPSYKKNCCLRALTRKGFAGLA